MISFVIETAATIVECLVAFSVMFAIFGTHLQKRKRCLCILTGTFLLSVITVILNQISLFSFITVAISIVTVALYSKLTCKAPLLYHITGSLLVLLVIHAIDYTVFFIVGIIFEAPINNYYTFAELLNPGKIRYIFLLIDKTIDVLVFLALRGHLPRLQALKHRHYFFLLPISMVAYILMSILLNLILSESFLAIQFSVILAWIFLVVSVLMVLVVLLLFENYQGEKETNNLLQTTNTLMEQNYQQYHENLQRIRDLQHNFNHHLGAIRELAKTEKTRDIEEYIDALIPSVNSGDDVCRSGNHIVDAIINFKQSQARMDRIRFTYQVDTVVSDSISLVDICAILGNQIDNALDACRLIEDVSQREISVHIWQQTESIVIFQVVNRVLHDPFEGNKELKTTKTERSRPHGLGIPNIRAAVKKYDGFLENVYDEGAFISTAYLAFN